ncbi:hypothetical protein [Hymenobacter sp. B1770]|uniref:hypothetical protein n=1 Tax=Hymenobacter sp. B1770 TaxID=1718788 RepID=UPI003CEDB93A
MRHANSEWVDKILYTALVVAFASVAKYVLGITLVLVATFIAVMLVFLLSLLVISQFSDKKFHKEYKLYLERMNGARFFCYNNRKSSIAFAQDIIVPALDPSVHVVFVEGSNVKNGPDSKYISKMLYGVKERKGFPYLLKIENCQVIDTSVNNQFYSIMIGSKPIGPLLDRINAFYNSTPLVSIA